MAHFPNADTYLNWRRMMRPAGRLSRPECFTSFMIWLLCCGRHRDIDIWSLGLAEQVRSKFTNVVDEAWTTKWNPGHTEAPKIPLHFKWVLIFQTALETQAYIPFLLTNNSLYELELLVRCSWWWQEPWVPSTAVHEAAVQMGWATAHFKKWNCNIATLILSHTVFSCLYAAMAIE